MEGQTLTRRQLRELREREAAQGAAPQQQEPPQQPAPQQRSTAQQSSPARQQRPAPQQPATPPQRPAPQQPAPQQAAPRQTGPRETPSSASPFVSRRELREAAPAAPPQPGAPVRQTAVRPPTTGAIRGLDAAGGLGEVRPASTPTPRVPEGHFAEVQGAPKPHAAPSSPTQPVSARSPQAEGTASTATAARPLRPRADHGPDARPAHGPGTRPDPGPAARPEQGPGARPDARSGNGPATVVAPGVPVPPVIRQGQPTAPQFPGMPAQPAAFVPARPDMDVAGPRVPGPQLPPSGAGATGPDRHGPVDAETTLTFPRHDAPSEQSQGWPFANLQQAPSPHTGWTPAVSGAVRAPVEPGTLPPGVIAPVAKAPPAGTFVPTGATPIVTSGAMGLGTLPHTAAPTGQVATAPTWDADAASDESTGTVPAWGRIGVSVEDLEADEEPAGHGYTWLHMVVLSLVAFVAGFLVWLLLLQGRGSSSTDALAQWSEGNLAAAPYGVVVEPPGEL